MTKGHIIVKPTDPYYPQHAFLGWKIVGSTSYYDFTQPVTSDLVLVAEWEKIFDVTVTGATVTITPVGVYAVFGVYVDWGGRNIETASGLFHKFTANTSGMITVYNEKSRSPTCLYSVR